MDAKIIAAALLWIRNHYEVNLADQKMRDDIIRRVDSVLETCHPTVKDMERFRELFPGPTPVIETGNR